MIRRALFYNFNFIYQLSHWTRRHLTSAGILVISGIIFSGVFGIDTRQTLSFQIFTVLTILFLFSIIASLTFRGRFTVKRKLPEYCTVGQPFTYRLKIKNHTNRIQDDLSIMEELTSPMPTYKQYIKPIDTDKQRNWFDRIIGYPRWLELIHKNRGASIPIKVIDTIPANDEIDISIDITPVRRGYLNFESSTFLCPDPTGLFNASTSVQEHNSLLVLPKRYSVPPVALPGTRKYQRGGVNEASTVGDSQEIISLRDYRPGDPIKNIHWRSFAKLSKPIVKEFQDEFFVRIGLVLDTFISDADEDIFEEAVSVAASFITEPVARDSLLDLMFVGLDKYCFTSGRNVSNVRGMLEILACVDACYDRPFDELSTLVSRNLHALSGLICIFLGWDDSRMNFVQHLKYSGAPVLVYVISNVSSEIEYDIGPMQDTPDLFHVLNKEIIEEQLLKLSIN